MWAIDLRMDLGRKMRFVHVWTHAHILPLLSWWRSPRMQVQEAQIHVQIPEQLTRKWHLQNHLHEVLSSAYFFLPSWLLHWQSIVCLCAWLPTPVSESICLIPPCNYFNKCQGAEFLHCKYLCKRENKHNSNLILRYSECFQAYINYTMQLRVK